MVTQKSRNIVKHKLNWKSSKILTNQSELLLYHTTPGTSYLHWGQEKNIRRNARRHLKQFHEKLFYQLKNQNWGYDG